MSDAPLTTDKVSLGRDGWTMNGTLDLHGAPIPFESHWVRAEWADAEIQRLQVEYERYKQCLYRANGRLIQLGQEPEKLSYE